MQLKIAGQDSIQTRFGGLISVIVYTLIFAFTITRFIKLSNKDDPFMFEVKESVDLLAEGSP